MAKNDLMTKWDGLPFRCNKLPISDDELQSLHNTRSAKYARHLREQHEQIYGPWDLKKTLRRMRTLFGRAKHLRLYRQYCHSSQIRIWTFNCGDDMLAVRVLQFGLAFETKQTCANLSIVDDMLATVAMMVYLNNGRPQPVGKSRRGWLNEQWVYGVPIGINFFNHDEVCIGVNPSWSWNQTDLAAAIANHQMVSNRDDDINGIPRWQWVEILTAAQQLLLETQGGSSDAKANSK